MTAAALAAKLTGMLATILLAASLIAPPARAASPATVPDVVMDEYIVARAADYPAVRTFGVATCIAVTLYDPAARVGALAHISAEAKIGPSLETVLRGLLAAGAKRENLRAQIIGGWRSEENGPLGFRSTSPEMLDQILATLARHSIPVARQETLVSPNFSPDGPRAIRNLSFDLGTGELSDVSPSGGFQSPVDRSGEDAAFARTGLLSRHPLSLDAPK